MRRNCVLLGPLFVWLLLISISRDASAVDSETSETSETSVSEPQSPQRRGRAASSEGVYKERIRPHWFGGSKYFWYRNNLRDGAAEFVLVDTDAGKREAAFDHSRLAQSLSMATGSSIAADKLPFSELHFADDAATFTVRVGDAWWLCDRTSYECRKLEAGDSAIPQLASAGDEGNDRDDVIRSARGRRGRGRVGSAISPDGRWQAIVRDGNVYLRAQAIDETATDRDVNGGEDHPVDSDQLDELALSDDGTVEAGYQFLEWSPDSATLVAFRTEPGDNKEVYLIESSPNNGGRAILHQRAYALPGDKLTTYHLTLFDVASRQLVRPQVDPIVMEWGRPRIEWCADSRSFFLHHVDRGHQRLRIERVDGHSGQVTTIMDEVSETFIWTAHTENLDLQLVNWLPETDEVLYVSERDGWRHLYMLDGKQGGVKHQLTAGYYVVRGIDRIDTSNRQVWFHASGKNPDQDPYFVHYYRVNFDGTGLVALTEGNGNHSIEYSPDGKYLLDTYSRVDMAPVHELRRAEDGALVCQLEIADISELQERGYSPLEVFVAKGRDGTTDIWGVICRPKDFDPHRKYPIIESIYAGPQGSFVPKSFSSRNRYAALADLGFIVVQLDGMGTANRSKAFHDVCWHNLKDAGYPDRILWIKAAAEEYPEFDLDRVGVYGVSAGGQNAAAAVLFYSDFYKAAVAACGCHDNRMDKASWNEQWMGYPVGPQYSECSNIDNAHRLGGKLLLIVGEMDDNVPPESTMRLADSLIKADKDFDLVVVPGAGHGIGGDYGQRRMRDFFLRVLGEATTSDRPSELVRTGTSDQSDRSAIAELRSRYSADMSSVRRFYRPNSSPVARQRLWDLTTQWLAEVAALDAPRLDAKQQQELAGFRDELLAELAALSVARSEDEGIADLLPYADALHRLAEDRWSVRPVNAEQLASTIDDIALQVEECCKHLADGNELSLDPSKRKLAIERVQEHRDYLREWNRFYDGYDPQFSWWVRSPYQRADKALEAYVGVLKDRTNRVDQPNQVEQADQADQAALFAVTAREVPDLRAMLGRPRGVMEAMLLRYQDETSPQRGRGRGRRNREQQDNRSPSQRLQRTNSWLSSLQELDFGSMSQPDRVDYLLLANQLRQRQRQLQTVVDKSETESGEQKESERDERERSTDESSRERSADPNQWQPRPAIGHDGLMEALADEMVSYTPEQLIEIADREYQWCRRELLQAARELGYGDDWQAAVEHVKSMHVAPGGQPQLIHDLAWEAIDYLREHDLVTVPPLAAETWAMQMMTPERQLVNPFFTGGPVISVSFPTDSMAHEAKVQSLRGNNVPFARATVHHELIPGHNLQAFAAARYRPDRRPFSTPFWTEGWALYWEMRLYELGFPRTAEDRIGFLVWRAHRCARIVFSLNYHLRQMTPDQCVEYLVSHVGFERNNAAAEVRRSFEGAYSPLYQAAYMLGGLQLRQLHREIVVSGNMTERQFHDAILQEGNMPIVMVRALLQGTPLTRDGAPEWLFYGPVEVAHDEAH
ncbi:MAG: DUF885 family protein [Pirellulaceae bacterium]|nr:DUF885 family protein [Planctomycetales bacterium]